jgi:hypothetical protein
LPTPLLKPDQPRPPLPPLGLLDVLPDVGRTAVPGLLVLPPTLLVAPVPGRGVADTGRADGGRLSCDDSPPCVYGSCGLRSRVIGEPSPRPALGLIPPPL